MSRRRFGVSCLFALVSALACATSADLEPSTGASGGAGRDASVPDSGGQAGADNDSGTGGVGAGGAAGTGGIGAAGEGGAVAAGGTAGASGASGSAGSVGGAAGVSGMGGQGGSPGPTRPGCTDATFMGGLYRFCTNPMNHGDAAADCAAQNMRLVRVDSSAENAFLLMTGGTDGKWIGATDGGTEGAWQWPDGEVFFTVGGGVTPGNHASWDSNEPNDDGGQDCGYQRGGAGLWDDIRCDDDFAYVCEFY